MQPGAEYSRTVLKVTHLRLCAGKAGVTHHGVSVLPLLTHAKTASAALPHFLLS